VSLYLLLRLRFRWRGWRRKVGRFPDELALEFDGGFSLVPVSIE
jgi:hypothetical protein